MAVAGRVVIVTGAARGIGAATAERFASEGVRLALVDVDGPGVEARAAGLRGRGLEAMAFEADAADPAAVERLVEATGGRWGRVDVLVNNAGGFASVRATEDISDDEWAAILRSNLTSAFVCARAVLPRMKRQRAGRIVNVASLAGRGGAVLVTSHYAAAKAGVIGFTRHLALEAGPFGITVNAVCPGTTATARVIALRTPEETARIATTIPVRRLGRPEEIADAIAYLASEAASFVNGAAFDVNGGQLMA